MNDIIEAKKMFSEFNFSFLCIGFIQLQTISPPLLQNILFKAELETRTRISLKTQLVLFAFQMENYGFHVCESKRQGPGSFSSGFKGLVVFSKLIFCSFPSSIHYKLIKSSILPSLPLPSSWGACSKKSDVVLSQDLQAAWCRLTPVVTSKSKTRTLMAPGSLWAWDVLWALLWHPPVCIWHISWGAEFGGYR